MSARYAPLPDLFYIPTVERAMMVKVATTNKQAAGVRDALEMREDRAQLGISRIEAQCRSARQTYEDLLELGWAKELARGVLPVFQYSKMRASANLRNWLAFMTLRCDPNAQWEIQQFAGQVAELIKQTFPQTHALWAGRFEKTAVGA
jgi:thymidylate synthase (FAD)